MNPQTQYEKILTLMIKSRGQKEWFYPFDFMKPDLGELFVGYEASARLSELTKKHPLLFEAKREGKYIIRRFKFEDTYLMLQMLPPVMAEFIRSKL